MQARGKTERFACIYHNWTYDHAGNLTNVAFRRGIAGKGGMPADANPESQAPRKLRVATLNGLVFGTLSPEVPALEDYIGPTILPRLKRVLKKPLKVLGAYTQVLPSNWKLYMDNVKDTYHASLLHLFFTRFRINRLTQAGGVFVSKDGAHHCTYTKMVEDRRTMPTRRTACAPPATQAFMLEKPEMLQQVDEFGDARVDPDPVAVPRLRAAPDPQLARRAPGGAEGRRPHRAALDAVRLRRRRRGDDAAGACCSPTWSARRATSRWRTASPPASCSAASLGAPERASVIEMGGSSVGSSDSRITETAVRGLWKAWRSPHGTV